jgi:hypothetical protein
VIPLNSDFKAVALKALKELKRDVERVKKTTHENGNINKEKENLKTRTKRNSRAKGIIMEMKDSLKGFKGKYEQEKERPQISI